MSTAIPDSPHSPKRALGESEDTYQSNKKVKDSPVETNSSNNNSNNTVDLASTLSKKEKKKYQKAISAGLTVKIVKGQVEIQPKVILRKRNDYASFKELHQLIFGLLVSNTKIPKWIDLKEGEKVKKVVVIDIPICDPTDCHILEENKTLSALNGDDQEFEKVSPLFKQFIQKVNPIFTQQQQKQKGKGKGNSNNDEEGTIFTIMGATLYDHRHGLHNRFIQLLQSSLTKSELKKAKQPTFEENKIDVIKPIDLILSYQDLLDEAYPLHYTLSNSPPLPEGWLDTYEGTGVEKKLMAIDCEMCKSENAFVLTKVALIDQDHNLVFNEFVKPELPITDYLTHYSGVDEQSLIGVTTTLKDIQQKILDYINGDVILVGHGLVNDLRAMQIRHPYIIDTAMIYHHKNGPPYKASLRDLASRYLKKEIQINHGQSIQQEGTKEEKDEEKEKEEEKGEEKEDDNENNTNIINNNNDEMNTPSTVTTIGHDPIEDAISSLELVKLKLKHGHSFGLHEKYLTEIIIDKLCHQHQLSGSIIDIQSNYPSLFFKKIEHNEDIHQCDSNQSIIDLSIKLHSQKHLVLLRLKQENDLQEGDIKNSAATESIYIQYLKRIYDNLEPNTAIILITGHYQNKELERLRKKWLNYKMEMKLKPLSDIPMHQRWSEKDEQESADLISLARRFFVYPFIKN